LFAKHFEAIVPGYRNVPPDGSDMLSRIKSAVLEGLHHVEALPRSHWVWQPGYFDRHVNVGRLSDFVRYQVHHQPTDPLARLIGFAFALSGAPDFGAPHLRALSRQPWFDASWPVYAAAYVQKEWGPETSVPLAAFLRELGLTRSAERTIQSVLSETDSY